MRTIPARFPALFGRSRVVTMHSAADCGDYVVVTNARQIRLTGKKAEQKVYRSHSQFPGGLKIVPYARMMENKPDMVCYGWHG